MVVALGTRPANGQVLPANATPDDVMRVAFSALEHGSYDTLAMIVDAAELSQFKRSESHSILFFSRDHEEEKQPAFPPCVVAFMDSMRPHFTQSRRERGSGLKLMGVRDSADLWALSPTAFFVRWMRAVATIRRRNDSLFWTRAGRSDDEAAAPEMRYQREVVGQVMVNDSVAYVVYDQTELPPLIDSTLIHRGAVSDTSGTTQVDTALVYIAETEAGPKIAQLRRHRRGPWRLLLAGDPFGAANQVLE
jgi:hypothetical protein